jgi:hypothetical protein
MNDLLRTAPERSVNVQLNVDTGSLLKFVSRLARIATTAWCPALTVAYSSARHPGAFGRAQWTFPATLLISEEFVMRFLDMALLCMRSAPLVLIARAEAPEEWREQDKGLRGLNV